MRADSVQVDVSSIRAGDTGRVTVTYLSDGGYAQTAPVRSTTPAPPRTARGLRVGCALLVGRRLRAPRSRSAGSPREASGSSAPRRTPAARRSSVVTVGPTSEQAVALATTTRPPDRTASPTASTARPRPCDRGDGRRRAVRGPGRIAPRPRAGPPGGRRHGRQRASVVVARADTPARRPRPAAQGRRREAHDVRRGRRAARRDPAARADSLAVLVAVGVGLVALTHLLAWLAGQLGRRRAEVAGLRAAGIGPRAVRRALSRRGRTALASIVLVTAAIAAAATTVPLLKPIQLVGGWPQAPGSTSPCSRSRSRPS